MACPYFIPAEFHPRELWPHRERLPLGDGFAGSCAAQSPKVRCDDETLRLYCNLGYAGSHAGSHAGSNAGSHAAGLPACLHLPTRGVFDAVRFLVQRESPIVLRVQFACELAHQPAFCGALRYDQSLKRWIQQPDPRLVDLAEAAVRAWMARNTGD